MSKQSKSLVERASAAQSNGSFDGLVIHGIVAGRKIREFPNAKTGEVRVRRRYRIQCAGGQHEVDAWGDHEIPTVGEEVSLPVYARAYTSRNGAQVQLTMIGGEEDDKAF